MEDGGGMSINPNDTVRMKLTETGKRLIVADIDRANDTLRTRPSVTCRFSVPKWDSDGWVTGQLHILLSHFGDCWGLGSQMPFTEMEKV